MKSVLCRLVGHQRSRRDARRIGDRWISYCRHCGQMMVRDGPQSWTVVTFVDGMPDNHQEEIGCR